MTISGVFSEARYLLISRLALPASSLFLLIFIGKQSDTLLGEYALVTTFYFVMQTLPLLGLTPYVLREAARSPQNVGAILGTVGALAIAASGCINLVAAIALPSTPYTAEVRQAIVVIGYMIVPGILAFLVELLLISLHQARWVAYTALVENVVRVMVSVIVLWNDGGIAGLMWVFFGTRCFALFSYGIALVSTQPTPIIPRFETRLLREVIKVLPVFVSATILALVISRLDYIVLSLYQHVDQIGYYAIAYRLLEIAQMAIVAIVTSIFPRLSRLYARNPRQFRAAAHLAFRALLAVLILIAFLGSLWADRYVGWLFTRQYPHPVPLAMAYIALIVVVGLDIFMAGLLNASDRQKYDLKAQTFGATSYAVLLFSCVPLLGNWGAWLAFAISITLQLGVRIALYQRNVGLLHWGRGSVNIGGVSLLLLAPLWIILHGAPPLWLTIASLITVVAYPLILVLLGTMQLGRTLLVAWPRLPNVVRSGGTLAGLCDHLTIDLSRWLAWRARAGKRSPRASRIVNHSLLAVVLYRWSRLFFLSGHTRLARLVSQINLMLTKAELQPTADAGPGLLLTHSVGTILVGKVGKNLTLGAWAAIGRRGHANVGGGPGMPVVGDNVILGHRSAVQGPIRCQSNSYFPHHLWVSYSHHLRAVQSLRLPVEPQS